MLLRAVIIAGIAILVAGHAMAAPAYDPVGEVYQWLWPPRLPQAVTEPEPTPADDPPVVATAPDPEPDPTPPEPPPIVTPEPDPEPTPPVVTTKPELAKPKPKPKPAPERRKVVQRTLPSCAVIRREYDRMSYGERLAAYTRATPAEIAHGKRCLGM